MKPTHTKFIARFEAELLSDICLKTEANEIVFDQVWLIDHGTNVEKAFTPTSEPKHTALISINSPNDGDPKERALKAGQDGPPRVDGFWRPLMLQFHDVDAPPVLETPRGKVNLWDDEAVKRYLAKYTLFDETMAGQVLDYLLEVEQAEDVYACWAHCQAGVSRSAAMSKFIADIYTLWFPKTYNLYNRHVYTTLHSVYNQRKQANMAVPGVL